MNTNDKFFWVVRFPVNSDPHDPYSSTWNETFTFFGTCNDALNHFAQPDFFSVVANCQRNHRSSVCLTGGAESVECLDTQGVRNESNEKWLFSEIGVIFEWDVEALSAFGSR
jgi:hypothetical protein